MWRLVQSKKPSAAKPPDDAVFFIDRSLSLESIRTELIASGLVVKVHDDHFARDEEDRAWLQAAGARGWVVLTQGSEVEISPIEDWRAASKQGESFRPDGRQSSRYREIAAIFRGALPRIFRVLHSHPGPFLARVSRSGQVTIT